MRNLALSLTAALALGIGGAVWADGYPVMPLKVTRVALFKNGLAYVTSDCSLPGTATVGLGPLPAPVLGTFWVAYPQDVKVKAVVTSMAHLAEEKPVASVVDMLSANIGRQAVLHTGKEPVSGAILDVTLPAAPESPSPYLMSAVPRGRPHDYTQGVVLVRTDAGVVALTPGSILRADIADATQTLTRAEPTPSMRIELDRAAAGRPLTVTCLARGMTWAPSYLMDLSKPEKARLSAKAVIVNEALDLDGVEVELVTGFPNILFSEINDPIAMTQPLADFLNALRGRDDRSRRESQWLGQQTIMANVAYFQREGHPGASPAYSAAQEGQAAEDLFFYPAGKVALKRGETAMLPLFTAEVPYEHVYTWAIEDELDEYERYRQDRRREGPEPAPVVWHVCRVENTMKMPWTTAPAEFLAEGRIVGQDVCHYTAPGSKTDVRINRALNLIAEQAEFEVERKRNAASFYGSSFDLVTVKGELKLTNKVGKDVRVEVTKRLSGEVRESAPEARDIPTAKGLKRVNPRHDLVWDVKMNAGGKTELSYVYTVYVRN